MMAASDAPAAPRCSHRSCSRRVFLAILLTLSCLANLMSYHGWLLTRLVGLLHLGILLCLLLLPSFPTGGVEVLPLVAAICQNVYAVHATKAWRKCQTGACDTMVVMACNVSASVWILLSIATRCAFVWFHSEKQEEPTLDTVQENAEEDGSISTESFHPPVAIIHQTVDDESHVEAASHQSGLENWRVSGSTIADSEDEIVSATGPKQQAGLFDDTDDDDDDSYNPNHYRFLIQRDEQCASGSNSALLKQSHSNDDLGHAIVEPQVANTNENSNATATEHVPKDAAGVEPEHNEHISGIESNAVPMETEDLDEVQDSEGVTVPDSEMSTFLEVEMTPATEVVATAPGEPTIASISKECEDSPMAEASADESAVAKEASLAAEEASPVAEEATAIAKEVSAIAEDVCAFAEDVSAIAKEVSVVAEEVATVAEEVATVAEEASAIAEADKPEDKATANNDPTSAADKAVEEKPSSSSAVWIEAWTELPFTYKDPEDLLSEKKRGLEPEKKRGLEPEAAKENCEVIDVDEQPSDADPEEPTLKRSKPTDESGDNRDRRGLAKTTGLSDNHEVLSIADSSDEESTQDAQIWHTPVELFGGNDSDGDDCISVDTALQTLCDGKRHLELSSDKEAAKKRKLDDSAKSKAPLRRLWDPSRDSFAFDTSLDAAFDAAFDAPWPDPVADPPAAKSPPVASLPSDEKQPPPADTATVTTVPLVAVPPPLKPAPSPSKPTPAPSKPAPSPPKATLVKAARPPFKAASTPSKAIIRPSMRFAKAIPSKVTDSKAKQPPSKLSWKPYPSPPIAATGTWGTAKAVVSTANPQASSAHTKTAASPYKASPAASKATTSRAFPAFQYTPPSSASLLSQSRTTPNDSKASPSPCKPTPCTPAFKFTPPSSFPKSPPSSTESDSPSEATPLLSKATLWNAASSFSNTTPSSKPAPETAPSPTTEQDIENERRFVLVGKARLPGWGESDTTK